MADYLVVKQSVWTEPVDNSLPWQKYDANDANTFPVESAQIWVEFENGRNGPANFFAESAGRFTCFNAPLGALANQTPTRWAYKQWNPNIPQVPGAE